MRINVKIPACILPDIAQFIVNAPEYVKSLINEVNYLKNRLSTIDNKQ